jgi:hypothetical protein
MKLDAQIIHHNYITRMVIFSVFLFKNYRNQELVYSQMINGFLKKKVHTKLQVELECGPKLATQDSRDTIIESLLNEDDFDHMNLVVVNFKTPLKEMSLQIDLNQEEKWNDYLYS